MTVKDLVSEIAGNRLLVPEFIDRCSHRTYYKKCRIEELFEDIFAGQPVGFNMETNHRDGNLVLWELAEPVPNIIFYGFIRHFSEIDICNPYRTVYTKRFEMGTGPFRAVLGGADLLEFLYLGLRGTIASSSVGSEDSYVKTDLPPQTLYLNLYRPEEAERPEDDLFRFLTDDEYERESQNGYIWVKAGRILDEDVKSIIGSVTLPPDASKKAEEILIRLADRINVRKIISCCTIDNGSFDDALEMYFRITPRAWILPLMGYGTFMGCESFFYMLAVRWRQYNAEDEFRRLEKFIGFPDSESADTGFLKERIHYASCGLSEPRYSRVDILRTCLILVCDEFDLTVQNLSKHVQEIEDNWFRIERSLRHVYGLFKRIWGKYHPYIELDIENILVYWFFKKEIRSENYRDDLTAVKKWMALWNLNSREKVIEADAIRKIKSFIDETEGDLFPFDAIKNFMTENHIWEPFTDKDIEDIISPLASNPGSGYLLPLLCQDEIVESSGLTTVIRLFPTDILEALNQITSSFGYGPSHLIETKTWNSDVSNLCLVSHEKGYMKERMSLKEWAEITGMTKKELCVDDDISLDVRDFRALIENRRKNIRAILRDLLQ